MSTVENDVERQSKFTYDMTDLMMAAMHLEDPETKEFILGLCDELHQKSVQYLGHVLRSFDRTRDSGGTGRSDTHDWIIENLGIITRGLDVDSPEPLFRKWYEAPEEDGGLCGGKDRERIGMWAMRDAAITIRAQYAREEAEYESERSQGSIADAA